MKPNTKTSRFQKGYSILFLMLPFLVMSQDEFNDNTNDVTAAAPIDNYILFAMLIGMYISYRFLKTTFKIKTRN